MEKSPRHIKRKSILFKLAGKVSRFLGASGATGFNNFDFFLLSSIATTPAPADAPPIVIL